MNNIKNIKQMRENNSINYKYNTLAEELSINPIKYVNVNLLDTCLMKSIVYLLHNQNIYTTYDLLLKSSKELLSSWHMTQRRYDFIIAYLLGLEKSQVDVKAIRLCKERNISYKIYYYRNSIIKNDFFFTNDVDLSSREKNLIEKYKEAISLKIVDSNLACICSQTPNKIYPIISAFENFSSEYDIFFNRRKRLEDVYFKIPVERRKNDVWNYINIYSKRNQVKELLCKIYPKSDSKICQYANNISLIVKDEVLYLTLKAFFKWCASIHIENSIEKMVSEINLNERKQKYIMLHASGISYSEISKAEHLSTQAIQQTISELIKKIKEYEKNHNLLKLIAAEMNKSEISSLDEYIDSFGKYATPLIFLYQQIKRKH